MTGDRSDVYFNVFAKKCHPIKIHFGCIFAEIFWLNHISQTVWGQKSSVFDVRAHTHTHTCNHVSWGGQRYKQRYLLHNNSQPNQPCIEVSYLCLCCIKIMLYGFLCFCSHSLATSFIGTILYLKMNDSVWKIQFNLLSCLCSSQRTNCRDGKRMRSQRIEYTVLSSSPFWFPWPDSVCFSLARIMLYTYSYIVFSAFEAEEQEYGV